MTKTQTKPRSIVFYDWEIQALIAKRKSQFRRVIKPQPKCSIFDKPQLTWTYFKESGIWADGHGLQIKLPYGQIGERLCVEGTDTIIEITGNRIEHVQKISEQDAIAEGVDMNAVIYRQGDDRHNSERERLYEEYGHPVADTKVIGEKDLFAALFDSKNKKFPFEQNPWVFVGEFKVVER